MDPNERSEPDLRGRSFVLTRPAGENRAFAAALRQRGADVVTLAPFRMVECDTPELTATLFRAAANADVVVFASTMAVRFAFDLVPDWQPRGGVIAQGPATAADLAVRGIRCELPEAGFRSEEVLQHPWFDGARRVVRVTGAGGRDWLVRRLRERGVQASDLPVYARIARKARPEELRRIDALARPQLVVSSREALLALPMLLGNARWLKLATHPMIVSSARLAALAQSMQCTDVVVATSARRDDLIARIVQDRAVEDQGG